MPNSTAPTRHAAYLRARSALEAYLECELERLLHDGEQIDHIALGHSQMRELCASHIYTTYLDIRLTPNERHKERNSAAVGLWYGIEVWLVDDESLVQVVTSQAANTGRTRQL